MRKIKVGINGFGRIGRAIYRINHEKDLFDVTAINDINPDVKNIAYLLQYDSTYGRFKQKVCNNGNELIIQSKRIKVFHEKNILDVPWSNHDVDVVIDASGVKINIASILNSETKIKHFLMTNATPDDFVGIDKIKTIILGVNENDFEPKLHKIISCSICDTVALTPIIKVISETHDIESGFLTTLHPWLTYQNLLDGPSVSWSQPGDIYSHYALGRASTQNLIPKSTSAHIAAEHVFPGISKKIHGFSFRVPTSIVSGAVLVLILNKDIDKLELIDKFYNYQKKQKYDIIENSSEPLTSIDYAGHKYSVIIDHRWTQVEKGKYIKFVYWYDNEWGYSSRVIDTVSIISGHYGYKC